MEKQSIEDLLRRDGKYLVTTVGTSMKPMLRDRCDSALLIPAEGRLSRFDVPLYRRVSGELVLHRVLKVHESGYTVCGDNQLRMEHIRHDQVIGVLRGFYRKHGYVDVHARTYRAYVFFWCRLFWLRKICLRCKGFAAGARRALCRKNRSSQGH